MKQTTKQTYPFIKPLFLETSENMGKVIFQFANDDYNKALGQSLINANNDAEAISAFLREYRDSPETLKLYAKEIERLLLWCLYVSKINISSLRRDHLIAYYAFLKNPQPYEMWCGSKASRQLKDGTINPEWRPFYSGLAETTIKKAIKIIDSFLNYLVQTNYLIGNPIAVEKKRKRREQSQARIIDRYLELDEINSILDALDDYPVRTEGMAFNVARARYIVLLLFYTGLRIAEASKHTMGDFNQRNGHWFLRVLGKGKKLREIPIPDELMEALAEFRLSIGLPMPQPSFKEATPLIPMHNLKQSISSRRVDQILKWAFGLAATRLDTSQPRKASKLRLASAHWLRHSYVTYLLESGAPLKVAQENAGHSDISTTMHYRHVSQVDRHAATRQLSIDKAKIAKAAEDKLID